MNDDLLKYLDMQFLKQSRLVFYENKCVNNSHNWMYEGYVATEYEFLITYKCIICGVRVTVNEADTPK